MTQYSFSCKCIVYKITVVYIFLQVDVGGLFYDTVKFQV